MLCNPNIECIRQSLNQINDHCKSPDPRKTHVLCLFAGRYSLRSTFAVMIRPGHDVRPVVTELARRKNKQSVLLHFLRF